LSRAGRDARTLEVRTGLVTDWHPSAIRGLVITLSGEVEHEAADSTRHRFGPGNIFLAEDITELRRSRRNASPARQDHGNAASVYFEYD
jgi:hypothetical protein